MKKFLALFLMLAAFAAAAFSVVDISPTPRGQFAYYGSSGKLVAVEVFAPTNGTVNLKSVWQAVVFTNAVQIESSVATNMYVVSSNRTAALTYQGSVVVTNGIVAVTNAALGTVSYVTNISVVATNYPAQVVFTNAYPAAGFSLAEWQRRNPVDDFISATTNVALVATTNTLPVIERTVAVTNDLVFGSAAASVFTATPAGTNYLAKGETLLYDGAGGGFLRLVVE